MPDRDLGGGALTTMPGEIRLVLTPSISVFMPYEVDEEGNLLTLPESAELPHARFGESYLLYGRCSIHPLLAQKGNPESLAENEIALLLDDMGDWVAGRSGMEWSIREALKGAVLELIARMREQS